MSAAPARSQARTSRPARAEARMMATVAGIELRRSLRDRRALVLSLVLPPLFFLAFGLNASYAGLADGRGNVSASIMVSMALYGAVLAATNVGASVSYERAEGWSRQLRLTPLPAHAHVAAKLLVAVVVGLASVTAVYLVGLTTHEPAMPTTAWILTGLLVWLGSLLFAALGQLLGHLFPPASVTAAITFTLAASALFGGLFIPLDRLSPAMQSLAPFTPLYGLGLIAHAPLAGTPIPASGVANVVAWSAVFVAGEALRSRRDR